MRRKWLVNALVVLALAPVLPAAAAGPELTITAPVDGAVISGDRVTVEFTAGNFKIVPSTIPVSEFGKRPDANRPGEGHLHLTLDLQPLVVWDQEKPYTFTNVPPGEHQVMVELANNDHSSLSPQVMRVIRFRVSGAQTLPNTGGSTQPGSGALLALALMLFSLGMWLRQRTRMAPD